MTEQTEIDGLGYFRGKKIPDYNPFWEEKEHQEDREDHWFWYHLGHANGWQSADHWLLTEGKDRHAVVAENESLKALIVANCRVNPEFDEYLRKALEEQEESRPRSDSVREGQQTVQGDS